MRAVYLCVIAPPVTEVDLASILAGRGSAEQMLRLREAPRLYLGDAVVTSPTAIRVADPVRQALSSIRKGPRILDAKLAEEIAADLSSHNTTELDCVLDLEGSRRWLMAHRGRICFTVLDDDSAD